MKLRIFITSMLATAFLAVQAQSFKFDLTGDKAREGYTAVDATSTYSDEVGYGYDFGRVPDGKGSSSFFSVKVPDGNYLVVVTLGSKKQAGNTTVRAESRRMYHSNVSTKKGELAVVDFVVNKHSPLISGKDKVKIKEREKTSMNWDDKLTLEFNGDAPCVSYIEISPANDVPTVFLCGNSTVVDNDAEPYTGWGQMLPQFFDSGVCIANYAESGLSANSFLGGLRLKKALTQMKKGDYVVIEFGHNDQKQKGPGIGAYYSYAFYLKQFIDEAILKGATPILVTPTRRRQFDKNGKIRDTHEDYPAVMREIATRENIPLVDFQEMTKIMFEAVGDEASKKMFVHYPEGTFEGQTNELKDNSHFSNFGAVQVSKCFVEGIKSLGLDLAKNIRKDVPSFNPAQPDRFEDFVYHPSHLLSVGKPKGS